MSDELRVPGYIVPRLSTVARVMSGQSELSPLQLDEAAQRAYGAFWGVLGPVSEQWAFMSEERKECWRGVVRAVLGG